MSIIRRILLVFEFLKGKKERLMRDFIVHPGCCAIITSIVCMCFW